MRAELERRRAAAGTNHWRFLEQDTLEWRTAWSALGALYGGDPDCRDQETGEVWQYMGSVLRRRHQFRHRALRGRCINLEIAAAAKDVPRTWWVGTALDRLSLR